MDPVLQLVARYRRRRLLVRGADFFLEAAFTLTLLAAGTLLVDRLSFELGWSVSFLSGRATIALLLGGSLGLGLLIAAGRLLASPVSAPRLAWELDRAAGAEDRLSSAAEFAGGEAPFVQALARDAAQLAGETQPARLLPRAPVGYRWGIALALGIAALLWTFPPSLYEAPQADFSASPLRGPAPLETAFSDTSIGAIDEFLWDYGDGERGTGEQALHVYRVPGRYRVRLTIVGPGGRASAEQSVEVLAPGRAVADFDAKPVKGRGPLKVQFGNRSRNAKQQLWTFGDGGTSAEPSPTHVYREPGLYSVTLRVENDLGADEKTRERLIKVAHPDEPLADFRAFPREGEAPLEVYFEDASEGELRSWRWDFGDLGAPDRVSEERNATHVYRRPGHYTVRLFVKGPQGEDEEEKVRYIRVKDPSDSPGGGGGGGGQPKPKKEPPKTPGGLAGRAGQQQPSERPKVELVPEELKAHKPGTDLEEKTLKVYTDRAPGGEGRPEQVPLNQVVQQFKRAAEDSLSRELIPPAYRDLVRRYYEGLAPK